MDGAVGAPCLGPAAAVAVPLRVNVNNGDGLAMDDVEAARNAVNNGNGGLEESNGKPQPKAGRRILGDPFRSVSFGVSCVLSCCSAGEGRGRRTGPKPH